MKLYFINSGLAQILPIPMALTRVNIRILFASILLVLEFALKVYDVFG